MEDLVATAGLAAVANVPEGKQVLGSSCKEDLQVHPCVWGSPHTMRWLPRWGHQPWL